jgi:hypothetical protein
VVEQERILLGIACCSEHLPQTTSVLGNMVLSWKSHVTAMPPRTTKRRTIRKKRWGVPIGREVGIATEMISDKFADGISNKGKGNKHSAKQRSGV